MLIEYARENSLQLCTFQSITADIKRAEHATRALITNDFSENLNICFGLLSVAFFEPRRNVGYGECLKRIDHLLCGLGESIE